MSNFFVAFLFSASIGTWIYSRVLNRSGGNTKSAITVACVSGALIFVIALIALSIVASMVE